MSKKPIVIVLDIDGVLVTHRSHASVKTGGRMEMFDPIGCGIIKRFCKEDNCKIVISSTWRKYEDHRKSLMDNFIIEYDLLNHFLGYTCVIPGAKRGEEIQEWLDNYGNPHYLIFDDDSDMLDSQLPYFIHCNGYDGILFQNYMAAQDLIKGFNK